MSDTEPTVKSLLPGSRGLAIPSKYRNTCIYLNFENKPRLCPYFGIDHADKVRSCMPMVMGGRVGDRQRQP